MFAFAESDFRKPTIYKLLPAFFEGMESSCSGIRYVKAKIFKEAVDVLGTSASIIRYSFKELIKTILNGVQLSEIIAIDEYKKDTDLGKY